MIPGKAGRSVLWFGGVLACAFSAQSAHAQEVKLSPLVDARLREEHVEQDGIADSAEAVTLRIRAGLLAKADGWSALVEAQGTVAIGDRYYDGLNGPPTRPLVADPQTVALYRAQVQYKDKVTTLTMGRQRISLDDDRFVDAGLFRQNGQTYDAARAEWAGVRGLRFDVTYAWNIRTVWGIDGTGTRPAAVPGSNIFAEVAYTRPIGTLTAFGYLVGQDNPGFQGFRLSSQTWGARLSGSRSLAPKLKLGYKLSFARQSDWRRNPNSYAANFYLADVGLESVGWRIGAGYEVAGASNGAPFTSFQFPVGSGFRYRGWAGKFNPTPPDGLRDLYGSLAYSLPSLGAFKSFTAQASFHRFESDRMVRHYGNELDLLVSGKLARYTLAARFAGYDADRFATRTRKFWLQLDWVY
jgi:hypothetical protein